MPDKIKINVADIIGSPLCISADDGQKIFEKIVPLVEGKKAFIISFERISTIISLFLNVAIGQLYGRFSEDEINASMAIEGLAPDDMEILERVKDNAKKYYANKDAYDRVWKIEVGDDE